jgi:hypothetical protein
MAKQTINIGASPNDGTGTPLRTSFDYCNQNFTELYTATGPSGNNIVVPGNATITGDLTVRTTGLIVNATGVGIGMTPAVSLDITNASAVIRATSSTGTNTSFAAFGNTGGAVRVGAENSAGGGLFTGSSAYSAVLGTTGAYSAHIGTNGNVRYTIDSTGISTWSVAGTTAMTLNSTGLGIGDSPASGEKLTVLGSIYLKTANKLKLDNASNNFGASIHNIGASAQAALAFTLGATQAMTLDASGNLLVGKTASSITTVGFQSAATGETSAAMAASVNGTTQWTTYSTGAAAFRFYVGMGGTVFATNTTISAISDARLKENVQDLDVGLDAILALKPRKFDWKAGKGKDIKGDRGFIAQEFETVFPNLIDEWKDPVPEGEAPYKSVRADLIPVLVKAIQELTARVQTLESR